MPLSDLQRHGAQLRQRAESLLADRLASRSPLDGDWRCEQPQDNLVASATPHWQTIAAQLGGGDGCELDAAGDRRPKFGSAFSSCALAVNSFAPFLEPGRAPTISQVGSFAGPVQFEAQRSAGVVGYKPNLDLVAEPADGDWLFVEGKCLEYLRPHTTAFSDAFVTKADAVLAPETAEVYAAFAAGDAYAFELLDAAQLLKHFLAAKRAADGQRNVALTYVFWEPEDADQHEAFACHRDEARQLAAALVHREVRLIALSYSELWASWDSADDAELARHVGALRARYAVTLGSDA